MAQETAMNNQETQFTPGPWEVREGRVPGYERTITIVGEKHLGICGMIGAGSSNPRVLENVRANARLIAAAPELLAACQHMQKSLNGSPTNFAGMLTAHRRLDAAVKLALNPKDGD